MLRRKDIDLDLIEINKENAEAITGGQSGIACNSRGQCWRVEGQGGLLVDIQIPTMSTPFISTPYSWGGGGGYGTRVDHDHDDLPRPETIQD